MPPTMPPLDLIRQVAVEVGDGRTLEGRAYRYDTPSLVRDPGAPPYLEEFTRTAASKSIRLRGSLPLMVIHDDGRLPVGVTEFADGDDGLMFKARVSETPAGDEALTLVNDGALRSVSIRFRSYGARRRQSARGRVTTRTEIGLRELSLVPTGFESHEGAGVLAVRQALDDLDVAAEGTPRLDSLRKRLSLLITP